jgi:uncharacterized SAM-binding protein YcdF (DUF218 family)
LWVGLYFESYRFTVVQTIGQKVPLVFKLTSFSVLLLVALYTVNGIYKGLLDQTPKRLPRAWFLVDFFLSMVFAVVCSDRQILFRLLSISIYFFDRLFYHVVYGKEFRRKRLIPP